MTLQQIHYALTILKMGSMNKAAEVLYISQPNLTNAIKELEQEFNITIFERTRKGVSQTREGEEFFKYARQVYQQYELLLEKYGEIKNVKRKFDISTQHYSFAIKAFVETVKQFDTLKYEFAIRETKTFDVVQDVANLKSEIGIIYMNEFNRKVIEKILKERGLEFHKLIECKAYVYMWSNHPLAKEKSISFKQLENYPCLSFEQGGDNESFYFSEEILSTNEYQRMIKATDRATMLNLMVGLNGYTLCSGIICEELNGSDFVAVPFEADMDNQNSVMEIGYIKNKNSLSEIGQIYIEEVKKYLYKE